MDDDVAPRHSRPSVPPPDAFEENDSNPHDGQRTVLPPNRTEGDPSKANAGETTSQTLVEEKILRRIPAEILALSLVIASGSLLFFSPLTGLFILAGGSFSAASFLWLKSALSRFLGQDRKKAIRSGLIFYLARLALLLVVFLIIILLFPRMVLAFAAGFSAIVLVFFVEAVRALSQIKSWKS